MLVVVIECRWWLNVGDGWLNTGGSVECGWLLMVVQMVGGVDSLNNVDSDLGFERIKISEQKRREHSKKNVNIPFCLMSHHIILSPCHIAHHVFMSFVAG